MMLTSKENNMALEILNDKLLKVLKHRSIKAFLLLSPSPKINNHEHTSHFKLVKDPISDATNDLLINKTIPVTLKNNLVTFRDTDKKFQLHGNLFKMITKKISKVDLANYPDKKIFYEFPKRRWFNEKA